MWRTSGSGEDPTVPRTTSSPTLRPLGGHRVGLDAGAAVDGAGCYRAVVGVTSAEPPTFAEPVVGAGLGVVTSVAL